MFNTQELRTAAVYLVQVELYCFEDRSQHVRKSANYDTISNINGKLAYQPSVAEKFAVRMVVLCLTRKNFGRLQCI